MKSGEEVTWTEEGVPFSPAYDDVYVSRSGPAQATEVFVGGNDLPARFAAGEDVVVLETGLGLGLNLCATLRAWIAAGAGGSLRYAAIELHPLEPQTIERAHARLGTHDDAVRAFLLAYPELLAEGCARIDLAGRFVEIELSIGDGAEALRALDLVADAIYLDGFAPAKNPGLWSDAVFAELGRLARSGATLATYTAASSVREGLDRAGFDVERCEGFARKRHRLVGRRR
ncbi:MAG: tRNA (5-methylaminomethyl-2-thiouridine)(34)-methyltransferase MnmD [Planctomycetota bacterium]